MTKYTFGRVTEFIGHIIYCKRDEKQQIWGIVNIYEIPWYVEAERKIFEFGEPYLILKYYSSSSADQYLHATAFFMLQNSILFYLVNEIM